MPLIDGARILNNLIVLFVLAWVFFLIWSKMDKEKTGALMDSLKKLFGKKED